MTIEQTELAYNPLYLTAIRGNTTHQYYNARNWRKGDVVYNNQTYYQVELLYDLQQQQLVIKHPETYRTDGLALDMKLIDVFHLDGHTFKKYYSGNSIGFYDILYEGSQFIYVAKRRKQEVAQKGGVELKTISEYYLVIHEKPHLIKNSKAVRKLFPQFNKEIKHIRGLGFRVNPRNEEATMQFLLRVEQLLDFG